MADTRCPKVTPAARLVTPNGSHQPPVPKNDALSRTHAKNSILMLWKSCVTFGPPAVLTGCDC